jgi:hypothetical protein
MNFIWYINVKVTTSTNFHLENRIETLDDSHLVNDTHLTLVFTIVLMFLPS